MELSKIDDDFLQLVKNSLRVDGTDNDVLLKKIIVTARKNIAGQIETDDFSFYDDNDEFDYAVVLLTNNLYTNRLATSNQERYEVPFALENLILSLKEAWLVKVGEENG
ncbi:hypothetical protein GNF18_10195 [Ligilactobacillus pobuzihii]|uniref:head-tail connector protein n=1 Tax=Ligilactobacillus pobuzihii TaxID=449659 RepID=UPI0019D06DB0|nr:head-tail connector protein [Ligilactobacillus pobuzihii]MBN7275510.1 hypothetical protein [Ligilactobacillus pobuzihii]